MGTCNHRVFCAVFPISRGPHSTQQERISAFPDNDVFEFRQAFIVTQFVPVSGINLATNAIHIQNLFRQQQAFGLQTNIINMIIPAGVFSVGAEINGWFGLARKHSFVLAEKFLQEPAHLTAQG